MSTGQPCRYHLLPHSTHQLGRNTCGINRSGAPACHAVNVSQASTGHKHGRAQTQRGAVHLASALVGIVATVVVMLGGQQMGLWNKSPTPEVTHTAKAPAPATSTQSSTAPLPQALNQLLSASPVAGLSQVAYVKLPVQGRETLELIVQGGPFPHDKDGTVFGNRERILPREDRGFYREYTVDTPNLNHRGAKRMVCAGLKPTQPERCFYTADHYSSFAQVVH